MEFASFLNKGLFKLYHQEESTALAGDIKACIARVVRELYQIDKRNELFEEDFWRLVPKRNAADNMQAFLKTIPEEVFHNAPHMIDFEDRAALFVTAMKKDMGPAYFPGMEDGNILIRRGNVYGDAYDKIMMMGEEFAGKYQIVFVDEFGSQEDGIDGGGLFKEFI